MVEFTSTNPRNPMGPKSFRVSWIAYAIENRVKWFVAYRDAIEFAKRKATKKGSFSDTVPSEARNVNARNATI